MNKKAEENIQAKRKKRRVLFVFVILVSIIAAYGMPQLAASFAPSVTVTFAGYKQLSRDIYTDGIVEELGKKEVVVQLPIVPSKVNISVGDRVEANDIIATIDKEATQAALFSIADAAKLVPSEYIEALAGISVNAQVLTDRIPEAITAPAAGIITSVTLVEGAMSMPQSTVCTIAKEGEVRLRMNVGETEADAVKEGDIVSFNAIATGDKSYTGVVTQVFPTASKIILGTSQKTVVGIYVAPDKSVTGLKPGYSVSGVLKKAPENEMLMLPYEVICQDDDNTEYVYCYENGKAVRYDIITGEEFTEGVCVISGITQNDAVIEKPALISGNGVSVQLFGTTQLPERND